MLVHIELFPNETSAFADYVLPVATGIEKGEIGRSTDDRRVVSIDKMIDPPGEAKPDDWIWIELGSASATTTCCRRSTRTRRSSGMRCAFRTTSFAA